MLKTLLVGLLVILSGCTTIDYNKHPDPDFPQLTTIEHHVDGGEVHRQCYKYVPMWMRLLGAVVEGCAVVDFEKNTCDLWVRGDYPDKRVYDHEIAHCRGYDHPNDDAINGAWRRYKQELLR